MATTRNAETPPNFVPKTLQNREIRWRFSVSSGGHEQQQQQEQQEGSIPVAAAAHGHHSKR